MPAHVGKQKSDEECLHMSEDRSQMRSARLNYGNRKIVQQRRTVMEYRSTPDCTISILSTPKCACRAGVNGTELVQAQIAISSDGESEIVET